MKYKKIFALIAMALCFAFAIVFNNTTSWTLFFTLIPVYLLCFILISKGMNVSYSDSTISASEYEPLPFQIATRDISKILNFDSNITNKSFSLPLISSSQMSSVSHTLYFSNLLKRGIYNDSLITLNISDPCGLITKNILKKRIGSITIYPKKRPQHALHVIKSLSNYISSKHVFGIESDYSIDSISEYKPYDPIKNIHWKLSSKNDETYVKHYNKFIKSTLNLALDPNFCNHFEAKVSMFYSLALQDTYIFKEVLIGEDKITLPRDLHKFSSLTFSNSNYTYQKNTLVVTSSYQTANSQCIQLVVSDNKATLYGKKGLKLMSIHLDGGLVYE